jgi:hypothetical protein
MRAIASFLTAFCISCITLGGLYLLVPNGKFQKAIKYTFSLCFLCCLISSFGAIGSFNFEIEPKPENEFVSVGAAAESARIVFERALKNSQINFRKITVLTDKAADGSISISKVTVVSNESKEKIASIISADGSFEVEVINE